MKKLLATVALALFASACGADDAMPSDPDGGIPSCASLGCTPNAFCTSDGTCWCQVAGESMECDPTAPGDAQ